MTSVLFVVRFNIALARIWFFELALDKKIRAVGIAGVLAILEQDLKIVARDRGRYIVRVKPHGLISRSTAPVEPRERNERRTPTG